VTAHAAQPNAQPGDLCFVDENGDKTINDQDRVFFDNPVPKLTTGLFLDSRWRSLDFGVNLRGAFGHRIYNAVKLGTERTVGLDNIRAGLQSLDAGEHGHVDAARGVRRPGERRSGERPVAGEGRLRAPAEHRRRRPHPERLLQTARSASPAARACT
jgi:hypothetical protein